MVILTHVDVRGTAYMMSFIDVRILHPVDKCQTKSCPSVSIKILPTPNTHTHTHTKTTLISRDRPLVSSLQQFSPIVSRSLLGIRIVPVGVHAGGILDCLILGLPVVLPRIIPAMDDISLRKVGTIITGRHGFSRHLAFTR